MATCACRGRPCASGVCWRSPPRATGRVWAAGSGVAADASDGTPALRHAADGSPPTAALRHCWQRPTRPSCAGDRSYMVVLCSEPARVQPPFAGALSPLPIPIVHIVGTQQ